MKSFCEEWEVIHATQDWGKYPPEAVIRFVARNYYGKDRAKTRFLDFGCGGGAVTWYLAREGFDVYAFDGSRSAIIKAEKYLKDEGFNNVKFEVADALQIGYEPSFFDCVIDNVCVYANKMDDIRLMYDKIYSILNEGGKLFTSCFGTGTDGYNTGVYIEEGTYENIEKGNLAGRGRAHFYEIDELKEVLKAAGFKNVIVDILTYTDNGVTVEIFNAQAEK